jgi:PTH1 family peptidyl-tRNA hydrolase
MRYARSWHNAGFMLLDLLQKKLKSGSWQKWQNNAEYLKTEIEDKKIVLLKPLNYMNNSGAVLSGFMNYHKIKPAQILVCYDDASLDLGIIRIRKKGSAGGHNGIKDIITHIGTDEFARIKIGVGPVPEKVDCRNYVLSKVRRCGFDHFKRRH